MKLPFANLAPLAAALLLLPACVTTDRLAVPAEPRTSLQPGMVSAADLRAEAAGEEILKAGGSAADAAIATMLALTVVEPQSSGFGGGGFMVHADASGAITTYDGRETAPAAASPDWFLGADGKPQSFGAVVGTGLSVGVPGNIALAFKAHQARGKLPWADLFQPAIRLASDGWVMNRRFAGSLEDSSERGGSDPYAMSIYYDGAGKAKPVGTTITNPRLAQSLLEIATDGPDVFYQRWAEKIASHVATNTPGSARMTAQDVRSYQAKERPPVCGTYRTYKICGMGPPTSGGIAVLAMLAQLERFDMAALGPDSPQAWHLFLESQRLAYADRELYAGDSDFVAVPVAGLIDPAYLAARSRLISPDQAMPSAPAGTPSGAPLARADGDEPEEHGTSHFVVADAAGNLVSYTSTIESAFGSGLMVGGFYLNNELTDFSSSPEKDGKPVANRVEGGKRPRSSMSPQIVYNAAGEPVLIIGAAGGATIPVQVARGIVGVIDFGLPVDQALGLPLLMAFGNTVAVEKGSVLEAMIPQLKALGHDTIITRSLPLKSNAAQWVGDRETGRWVGARDPRIEAMLATE